MKVISGSRKFGSRPNMVAFSSRPSAHAHTHTCTGTSGHQDSKVRFWDIRSHYMHTMDLNSTSLIPRPQMHSREKGSSDNGTCCLINFRQKLHSLIILMLPKKSVRKGIVIFLYVEGSTSLYIQCSFWAVSTSSTWKLSTLIGYPTF